MVVTTAGPGTIDHNAGPLSRHWNARNSDQLDSGEGLDMKRARRTKVEQITRIIIAMATGILRPTPNDKGSAGEHGTMSETWFGNVSAGLQESCGEILC
jgi:hypothetical protein